LFGYLLLYRWATEDPPRPVVVVKWGYRTKPTLLTAAGCFELNAKSLADQLGRPEVRYVSFWMFWQRVDGVVRKMVAPQLLYASPCKMLSLGQNHWEICQESSSDCRYLVDGLNPMDVGDLPTRAQMVLVTSPDPKAYYVKPAESLTCSRLAVQKEGLRQKSGDTYVVTPQD
jgi:hypothetical protein